MVMTRFGRLSASVTIFTSPGFNRSFEKRLSKVGSATPSGVTGAGADGVSARGRGGVAISEVAWGDAIGQFKIEPVFPPEEDVAVGDVLAYVIDDKIVDPKSIDDG